MPSGVFRWTLWTVRMRQVLLPGTVHVTDYLLENWKWVSLNVAQGNCTMNELGVPQCICGPGFSGKKCEIDQCADFCQHGGTCIRNVKKTTCMCPTGYTGKRCEMDLCSADPSQCGRGGSSTPAKPAANESCSDIVCLNEGSCVQVRGKPLCRCAEEWAGIRCDDFRGKNNVCRGYCMNGGVCVSVKALDAPHCECHHNWTGPRCQHRTTCQHYCFNGGTCSLNPDEDLKPTCL